MVVGCRKKSDPAPSNNPQPEQKASLRFTFNHVVGNDPLALNTSWYKNENGDSFKVSIYKYYVTNIVLIKGDSSYNVPESYYLIDESNSGSKSFTLENIPSGAYDEVRFMIGVDEPRNTSGAQTGALDPIHGMFWDWKTGYIMAKLEGVSPQAPGTGAFFYHTGGFKVPDGAQRSVRLKLPKKATVAPKYYPNIIFRSDVLEWFKTPNKVSIATLNSVMTQKADVKTIADNYADMFTVEDVVIAVE